MDSHKDVKWNMKIATCKPMKQMCVSLYPPTIFERSSVLESNSSRPKPPNLPKTNWRRPVKKRVYR